MGRGDDPVVRPLDLTWPRHSGRGGTGYRNDGQTPRSTIGRRGLRAHGDVRPGDRGSRRRSACGLGYGFDWDGAETPVRAVAPRPGHGLAAMQDTTRTMAGRATELAARCREVLASREFAAVAAIAASLHLTPAELDALAVATAQSGLPEERWRPLAEACERAGVPASGFVPQRFLLLTAGLPRLPEVPGLPVAAEVKERLLDQFHFLCAPDRETDQLLNPTRYGFRAMCRFMLLRRFPAGQIDWEISGFPRSWLARVPPRHLPGVLNCVFAKARGRVPWFEAHTGFRRELPILTEEDERHSYRLLASSMEMQPSIRGFMGSSWFADPSLARVSPHLAWISDWYRECVEYGAVWTDIGEAHRDDGFLVGDRRRRRLYESGQWKPRLGLLLWARKDLLRWLARQGG